MRHFRRKVLLSAVVLVTMVQLVTLVPILDAVDEDANDRGRRSTRLAGVVFDELMMSRAEQLATTAKMVVSDFALEQAFATHEPTAVETALRSHVPRAGTSIALLYDLDGRLVAAAANPAQRAAAERLDARALADDYGDTVIDMGGIAYQAVSLPMRAPENVARVVLGSPIDRELALRIESLTGLEVSFVRLASHDTEVLASTLSGADRSTALDGVDVSNPYAVQRTGAAARTHGYLTLLRPLSRGEADLGVALQLPMDEAMSSYRHIRDLLLGTIGLSLALAVAAAIWLAGTVTGPVRTLAAAARRMCEGNYDEPIESRSADELGELAAGFNAMQRAIAEREQRIFYQAQHDSLSGLPNRDLTICRLREALEQTSGLSVVSLGLDRFNNIVSSLGHRAGDDLIEQVAGRLRNRLHEGQLLGHLGGHQFVVALPDCDRDTAIAWAESTIDALRAGVRSAGANISLRAVAGIAIHPEHGSDAAELMRRASIANAEAYQASEPIVVYRSGEEDRFLGQIRIVGDFPKALQAGELELNFQPQIDCTTRRVVGAEALVRWRHPELGLLSPAQFVDAIEQAGGICHLTRWVLQEAVRVVGEWRRSGVDLALAANVSVDDLVDEYLPYFLLDVVRQGGLRPADVTLEITEKAIMRNLHKSLAVVSCIHELGFRIAIDDFGVGRSALVQLKGLPVDELKIDKSLVMHLQDGNDEAIVRSTIELAHHLKLGVVAEGVESAATLARLTEFGCETAQGYHIAAPLPAEYFSAWLAKWTRTGQKALASRSRAPAPVALESVRAPLH